MHHDAMQQISELDTLDGSMISTSGKNRGDSLAIGPWCYESGTPILLSKGYSIRIALSRRRGMNDKGRPLLFPSGRWLRRYILPAYGTPILLRRTPFRRAS